MTLFIHPQVGSMYKKRLEEDGVDPAIITSQEAPRSEEEPHKTPRTDTPTRTVSPHPQPTSASTTTTTTTSPIAATGTKENAGKTPRGAPTSAFVPKGAYRRIVCLPCDLSWTDAALGSDENAVTALSANDNSSGVSSSSLSPAADVAGAELRTRISSTSSSVMREEGGGNLEAGGAQEVIGSEQLLAKPEEKQKQGAVVGDVRLSFTLPPGSYATMCLREVMRQDFDISAFALGGGQ